MLGNVLLVVTWVASVIACYYIGKHKERVALGIVLGILGSWFGLIIFAMMPTREEDALIARQRAEED